MCESEEITMESGGQSQEEVEEPLDPGIQHQLDMMNNSAVLINKFENDLGLAHQKFRQMYADSLERLNTEASKIGSRIHKAAAYYDCRLKAMEAQEAVHDALTKYERAVSMESASREMVDKTEKGYEAKKRGPGLRNLAWPEMLNHATNKLLDSEAETVRCEDALLQANRTLASAQLDVRLQYKRNKKSISKSKLYYEMKSRFHQLLEVQKEAIARIETDCCTAKSYYSLSMSNLEAISNEIHKRRQASKVDAADHVTAAVEDINHNTAVSSNRNASKGTMNGGSHVDFVDTQGKRTGIVFASSPSVSPVRELSNMSSCISTSSTSLHSDDESDVSHSPSVMRRSLSQTAISHTPNCAQEFSKPRSMSNPSSPTHLASDGLSSQLSDSSMSTSYNSIIDDNAVEAAASNTYFDCDSRQRAATLPPIQSQRSTNGEDYETLPHNLSSYQRQYTLRRKSVKIQKESMDSQEVTRIFSSLRVEKAEH